MTVVPEGDDKERKQCPACDRIMYDNPKPVGGVVVTDTDGETGVVRVLLLRRGIEPRLGFWTIPGGFLENGESVEAGAAREAREEACCGVDGMALHAVYSVPHVDQIMLWFRGTLAGAPGGGPRFRAGHETTEARLFDVEDIPWDELAFPTTTLALRDWIADPSGSAGPVYRTVEERLPAGEVALPERA